MRQLVTEMIPTDLEAVKLPKDTEERLTMLVNDYFRDKEKADDYKKICDKENIQIKEIMQKENLHDFNTDNYRAVCSTSTRETINEEGLLSLFSSVPAFVALSEKYGIIKQKPYIDFDVIEKIIYDGKMTNEQILELDKHKDTKEIVTLRVTKIKKKKET